MHTLLHPKLINCRRLFLRNYEVPVRIGVHDFEKKRAQRLLVNVDLYIPLSLSTPVNDQLSEVVDYSFVIRWPNGHRKVISTFRKPCATMSRACCLPIRMSWPYVCLPKNPMYMKIAKVSVSKSSVSVKISEEIPV